MGELKGRILGEGIDRNDIIAELNNAGLDGPRLVSVVLRHCGYRRDALDAFFAATLVSEQTRAAIPWRMPSVLTPTIGGPLVTSVEALSARAQRSLLLLAASQELPPALRRDSLLRALRYADLDLRDLDDAVSASLLTAIERTDLEISPVVRGVMESRPDWADALGRMARATPAGHDQVRMAARAALPEIDIALSAMLESTAKGRRANTELLVTAQDLTVAALLAESHERGLLLIDVADVLLEAHFASAAIVALNEADSLLNEPALRAKSLKLRGRVELILGDPVRAASTQLRAAEILTGLDDVAAAGMFISAAGSLFLTKRADESLRLAHRARQLGNGDPIITVGADVLEGSLLLRAGECAKGEPFIQTLRSVCMHTVSDTSLTDAAPVEHLLWIYHSNLSTLERFDECIAFGHQLISLSNRLDRRQLRDAVISNQALAAWAQGHLFEAQSWVDKLDASDDEHRTGNEGTVVRDLVEVCTRTVSSVAKTSASDRRPLPASGEDIWAGYRSLTQALGAVVGDNPELVCASLEPLLRDLTKYGCRNFGHVGWLTLLVEAQIQTGSLLAARRTAQIQEEFASKTQLNYHRIPITRARALLADHDTALWDAAIRAHEAWGNQVELGHTLRSHGGQILRLPSHAIDDSMWTVAQADLERARFVFGESGATAFQWSCDRRLAEIATSRRSGVEASDREMDIVRLVQNGATNKEIANRLTLSLKTIESHLRNVYQRNGVRNRAELIARLRR